MANSCLSDYTLKGIGFDCNANLAGVKKVYLTYYDDITVSPDYSAHTISSVTFSSTAGTW